MFLKGNYNYQLFRQQFGDLNQINFQRYNNNLLIMNLQRPDPFSTQIKQLKELFLISRQICRQRLLEILPANPNNITLVEMMAACQSLDEKSKDYKKAIELYQECLKINPDNIAYYNNLAKNYIEIQDFYLVVAFLNDIKQKWNHPAIYFNLAVAYERGKVIDTRLLDDSVQMMQQYRKNYPDFQAQHQKGLIHTFLLQPDQNYNQKQIKQFDTQILQTVITLQNMLHMRLDLEQLSKVLQKIHAKIARRVERQQMYGIKIANRIKAIIQALQTFRARLIPLYKPQWKEHIEKGYISAITFINSNIFQAKIDNLANYHQTVYELQVEPCLIQLEVIAKDLQTQISFLDQKKPQKQQQDQEKKIQDRNNQLIQFGQELIEKNKKILLQARNKMLQASNKMLKKLFKESNGKKPLPPSNDETNPIIVDDDIEDKQLKQLRLKDEQIKKDEKTERQNSFERDEYPTSEYEFKSRLTEVEQFMVKYESFILQSLRVEGQSQTTPLFLILHLKQHNISSYHVYYNSNRIKAQLAKAPQLPNLQNVSKHAQRTEIIKYYHVLNLIFKFYNFFGTNNFQYKVKNQITNLNINHYVSLITPVLNQFFDGYQIFGKAKFGWIFNEIHFAMTQYLQSMPGDFLKTLKQLLKRINRIQETYQNPSQALMNDIMKPKDQMYLKQLLNHQLCQVYGSTKQHFYFNWKINRYHFLHPNKEIRSAFNQDQDWIISNVSLFLITLAEKPLEQDKKLLVSAFSQCFFKPKYSSKLSYKEEIIKKFYTSHHKINVSEKASSLIKRIIKVVIPFKN